MNATVTNTWYEANQRYLSAALSLVRNALEQHIARMRDDPDDLGEQNKQKNLVQAGVGRCYACNAHSCGINNALRRLWLITI